MNIEEELHIEYQRLVRNLYDLEVGFKEHIARDLVAGLRNIVELAPLIDAFAEKEGAKLNFPGFKKTKAEKAIFRDGSEAFYYPASLQKSGIQVAAAHITQGKMAQEDVRRLFEVGPPTNRRTVTISLDDWLGHSVYEYRSNGEKRSISRKLFIKRCANVLGGTHPASNTADEDYIKVFDEQIKELLNTKILDIPTPWAFVIDTGKAIAESLKQIK